jgi:hypothetical protein
VEFTTIELKFNVKTLFNSYFHLNWSISVWFLTYVWDDELFFFCYTIVITVDHYVNIVSQADHDSIICFKLLFHSIELEIVRDIICQCAWWLKISDYL